MRLIARYLTREFLKNYLVSSTALMGMHCFQLVMGKLVDHEFPFSQIAYHEALQLPEIFVQMTPPAVLIAMVFTLATLNRQNELVACYSLGIGLNQLVGVLMCLVVVIACFSLVLQDRILPPMYRKRTTYYYREMKKKLDFYLDAKQDKIWYRSKNLIYNLRTFDPATQKIQGMVVYTFDERFHLIQLVDAKEAQHTDHGWKLQHGTITVFSAQDGFPLTQKFEEKTLPIAETPKDFQEIEKEVNGLRLKELYAYIQRMTQAGVDTRSYQVDFWGKLSLSFIPIVMGLLAIPFSTRSRREGGMAADLGICLVFTFFYWLFYSIGLSLGKNGAVPPWLGAWMPSFIFLVITLTLISRKNAN